MDYEIYSNNVLINIIHATEEFVRQYCAENGYEYVLRQNIESDSDLTTQDDTDAMLIDHEYRITLLELGVSE